MSFTSWLRTLRSALAPSRMERKHRRQPSLRATTYRPRLEALEDRSLPSTFTVLNLLDSGPDSLRAAVVAANANPGPDAIDFAVTGSISLTSGQLDITDSLTINGPGASALTVSGEGVSRVFGIAGAPTVLIANLTIANGRTYDSPGGGIAMAGGALTLDHVTVSGNYAIGIAGATNFSVGSDGGPGAGGGLSVAGGTVFVNQSTVSGNHALGGTGGDGQWYYDDTYGGNGGGATGGGIAVGGGTVHLYQSTLADNTAGGGYGGAGTFPCLPGGGVGGGLAGYGTVTLDQCTVSGNAAIGGPGGVGSGGGYYDFLRITGAQAEGGGLYVAGGVVNVNRSTVAGNHALGGAGGVTFNGFEGYGDGGAAAGGGIRVAAGTVQFYQSSLSGNSADGGGSGGYPGSHGVGVGGGLSIASAAPPLADLDTFTEANTINNFADVAPNISGPYSLNGTLVPPLALSDVSILEGNSGTTDFVFTVSLSAPSSQAVSVNYATADGSATAGSDYQAASGTLTIPAGQMTGTITVLVNGDRLGEPNETFFVNLSAPTNATIADGQGIGTILDDEPRISINYRTVTEGNTGTVNATFTVSLSAPSSQAVSVNYATADGSAAAGSDYQAVSGTLTILAGQTTGTITVLVNGDRLFEPTEAFFVNLSSPTNATIYDGSGVGGILDDEPRISISDVTKAEGKKNQTTLFTFTVTLSAAYDQAVTVSYRGRHREDER